MNPLDRFMLKLAGATAFVIILLATPKTPDLMVATPITVQDTMSDSRKRDYVVAEFAQKYGIDTALALNVSHAENWTGRPDARSPVGAVGVMQVMPNVWRGVFPECGQDLTDLRTNVCYGINILRHYLVQCGYNTFCALNRYNGARRAEDILAYHSEVGRAQSRRARE